MSLRVLFSDIDGTCVHYPDSMRDIATVVKLRSEEDWWHGVCPTTGRIARVIKLPPSTSGAQGMISLDTLRLYQSVRSLGVKLALVTGARLSTLLARLPFLPAADAYVCEGGGRIFYPVPPSELPTAVPLREDMAWRLAHVAAGPPDQEGVPPERRSGLLWQHFADLAAAGYVLDAASYTTSFRLRPRTPEDAEVVGEELPEGLACSGNLGALDVYPDTSGKCHAAQHLMARWASNPQDCALLCDDDNDLELAALVRRAYLPGVTADTVRRAAEADPDRFVLSPTGGVFGAEDSLKAVLADAVAGLGSE